MKTPNNKHREESFFKNVRNYFREYCNHTTIHGFRYFGEKRTIFERVWWFLVFMACLGTCAYSIYLVYMKWDQSPVIVSFATKATPIYEIPFPTVTICPEHKFNSSEFSYTRVFNKYSEGENITQTESEYFMASTHLCTSHEMLEEFESNFSMEDFYETLDLLRPTFELYDCSYQGEDQPCEDLFVPIMTDEGICYTFNMLDRTEIYEDNVVQYKNFLDVGNSSQNWSIEHGYDKTIGLEAYPRRALLPGAMSGLTINIYGLREDIDYSCRQAVEGYKVLLHSAFRVPRLNQQFFRIPLDHEVLGAIQPVIITTHPSIKLYDAKRRRCYFDHEKKLKFFKSYSALNCMLECRTNFTLETCGCVGFFMPRENGTKLCDYSQTDCMKDAYRQIHMQDLEAQIGSNLTRKLHCDCMPLCADLSYEMESSQAKWTWDKTYESMKSFRDLNITKDLFHLSSLTLYFKSNNFITSQRNELYGPTDFLANFGGLLGLFTGFSVLSLMEILYYLSVRLVCNSRLYGYWAGPDTS